MEFVHRITVEGYIYFAPTPSLCLEQTTTYLSVLDCKENTTEYSGATTINGQGLERTCNVKMQLYYTIKTCLNP